MTTIPPGAPMAPRPVGAADPLSELRAAAVALEASFLAEMLKSAGLDAAEGAFSGGAGEDQFDSFLRREQAKGIAESGGIGLAEQIFQSLKGRVHD